MTFVGAFKAPKEVDETGLLKASSRKNLMLSLNTLT